MHRLPDMFRIPIVTFRFVYVHTARDGFTFGEAAETIQTAVEKGRNSAAGFPKRPIEQRIVTPRQHERRLNNTIDTARGFRVSTHPSLDEFTREQKLARHAANRDRAFLDQVVNRPLLNSEQ